MPSPHAWVRWAFKNRRLKNDEIVVAKQRVKLRTTKIHLRKKWSTDKKTAMTVQYIRMYEKEQYFITCYSKNKRMRALACLCFLRKNINCKTESVYLNLKFDSYEHQGSMRVPFRLKFFSFNLTLFLFEMKITLIFYSSLRSFIINRKSKTNKLWFCPKVAALDVVNSILKKMLENARAYSSNCNAWQAMLEH